MSYIPNSVHSEMIKHVVPSVDLLRMTHVNCSVDCKRLNGHDKYQICDSLCVQNTDTSITHNNATTDLVLTDMQVNDCAPEYLPPTGLSKLKCILVQTTTLPPPPPRLYTVRYHPYRNPTARDFGYWITAVDWSFLENMEKVGRQENAFCFVLRHQYRTHFPVKVWRGSGTEQPWITPELNRWINKKRRGYNCVTMGLYRKLSSE